MLRAYTVEEANMVTDASADSAVIIFGLGGCGAHLVVPLTAAPVAAFLLVLNRVYWRYKLVGRLGPDDVWTILALVGERLQEHLHEH